MLISGTFFYSLSKIVCVGYGKKNFYEFLVEKYIENLRDFVKI